MLLKRKMPSHSEDSFGGRILNFVVPLLTFIENDKKKCLLNLVCFLACNVGFAFIYMDDERDAEDAIRGLDRTEFGRKGRRLRVEWTKVMSLLVLILIFFIYLIFIVLINHLI